MPHRSSFVAVFVTSLFTTSSGSAANILLISDALKPGVTLANHFHQDDSFVSFLEGLGHTVDTAGMHQGVVGDDGGQFREPEPFSSLTSHLASNPADLIIVSRATAISAYNDARKDWNELDVPLILMNGFLPRATVGWQWTTGTDQAEKSAAAFDIVLPTHSFVDSLDTATPNGEIAVFSTDVTFRSLQTTSFVAGSQVVATVEDGTPALVDIPAGTVFGGDASTYGVSSKRRVFIAYDNYFDPIESGGLFDQNLTTGASDSGEALLGQVIASVLANPNTEPEDSGGGDGGGATASSPEPATIALLVCGAIAGIGIRWSRLRRRRLEG